MRIGYSNQQKQIMDNWKHVHGKKTKGNRVWYHNGLGLKMIENKGGFCGRIKVFDWNPDVSPVANKRGFFCLLEES